MMIENCPDCTASVVLCDNNVRLDYPAEPWSRDLDGACWRIMLLGPLKLAATGGEEEGGLGHRLHAHQPEEDR